MTRSFLSRQGAPIRQRGAVLLVALIFVILVALLALTAMGTSVLQERMTGGVRNAQLAMMGAESALRGGESWLTDLSFDAAAGQDLPPCVAASVGTCVRRPDQGGLLGADAQQFRSSRAWQAAPAGSVAYPYTLTGLLNDAETASLATPPVFMVEDLGADTPPSIGRQWGVIDPENIRAYRFYRITARSQGGSAASQRTVESVFSAPNLTDTGTQFAGGTP